MTNSFYKLKYFKMIQFKFPVSGKTRTEHDLLGYKEVPEEALFGIQTLRCIENFNISNYHIICATTLSSSRPSVS